MRRFNKLNAVDLQSGVFSDIPQPFDWASEDRLRIGLMRRSRDAAKTQLINAPSQGCTTATVIGPCFCAALIAVRISRVWPKGRLSAGPRGFGAPRRPLSASAPISTLWGIHAHRSQAEGIRFGRAVRTPARQGRHRMCLLEPDVGVELF